MSPALADLIRLLARAAARQKLPPAPASGQTPQQRAENP